MRWLLSICFITLFILIVTMVATDSDLTFHDNYIFILLFGFIPVFLGPLWPGKYLNKNRSTRKSANRKIIILFVGASLYLTPIMLAVAKYHHNTLTIDDLKVASIAATILSFVGVIIFSVVIGIKATLAEGYKHVLIKRHPKDGEALAHDIFHMGDLLLKRKVITGFTLLTALLLWSLYIILLT